MLYAVRVHSVDTPIPVLLLPPPSLQDSKTPRTSSSSATAASQPPPLQIPNSVSASAINSKVKVIRGVVHLYRAASSSVSPDFLRPDTLLFVPAVPGHLSTDDFLHFCGSYIDKAYAIHLIKDNAIKSRYSVLVRFHDKSSADSFYANINGWRFSSMEAEVCHVLFIKTLEYTSKEIAGTPLPGFTELPTCPVCIERLDQDVSGIVATTSDRSFRCCCVSKWVTSSCSVCHFCREHCKQPICSVCRTSENLWICMICSSVGCGRYNGGHALRHWKETKHCFSLDLETQRIWDYVGESYVDRLDQSRSDGNSVKLKTHCKTVDDNFGGCECSDDSGISGALFSKVEAILDEYNRLLTTQFDNQRQSYESLLLEVKEKKEKYISEAVDKAVSLKMQELQLKLETIMKEKKNVADMNEKLMKSQSHLHEKIKEKEESMASGDPLRINVDVKLDGTNFILWSASLKFYLRGAGLWGHVTGSEKRPTSSSTDIRNWELADNRAMAIIAQTVAPTIRLQIVRFDTAAEIWSYLNGLYNQSSTAHEYKLIKDISAAHQGNRTIQEFFSLLTGYWEELATMEPQFSGDGAAIYHAYRDRKRLYHFLMRLRPEFEYICGQLLHRSPLPTLESALCDLLAEETRLQTLESVNMSSESHALVVSKLFTSHNAKNIATCFYCKEEGHLMKQCPGFHKKVEQEANQQNSTYPQKIVATAVVETLITSREDQIAQLIQSVENLKNAANNNAMDLNTTSTFANSDW